jgi:hypothetical protein
MIAHLASFLFAEKTKRLPAAYAIGEKARKKVLHLLDAYGSHTHMRRVGTHFA